MSSKLQKSLFDYNSTLVKEGEILYGNLGTVIGGKVVVSVPGRASFVYVRLRTKLSELIEAFNSEVAQKYNTPVLIERKGNRYVVIGRNTETFSDWETNDPYIPQHAAQHIFDKDGGNMGGDPVWVYPYQFMPSLVTPFGSRGAANVFLHSYPLHTESGWKYIGNTGTPRLTQYNPQSGATLVLVTLDTQTGNPALFATTGTFIPESVTGTSQLISYLPQVSDLRYLPDSFVRLVSGTSAIGWNNIYDVRQFLSFSPSGTSYLNVNGFPGIDNLEFSGATFIISGSSVYLDFVGGGGGSSPADSTLFYVEGRLATGTNISNMYMITQPITINQVGLYVDYLGVTGTTTVDINLIRSGTSTTIFTTQSNRPTLQYNNSTGWILATPNITSFGIGDVLELDIDSVSLLSDTLVVSKLVTGSSSGGGSLTVEQSGGLPSVAGVDKIVVSGVVLTDQGGGQITLARDYILVRDEKAANTAGGTFNSGAWRTRVINTEVSDVGNHCSIGSNQITLVAGTYECRITAPSHGTDRNQAKLYNISDSANELIGSSSYSSSAGGGGNILSVITGRFTISATKIFEIQHQCQTSTATNGFGVESNFGEVEIYTIAEFWKVE
jgi:hypothetical protein